MHLVRAIIISTVFTALVSAEDIEWVEIERAAIGTAEVTLEIGTCHGIPVEELSRSTLRSLDGALRGQVVHRPELLSVSFAPPAPLPSDAWSSVTAHLSQQGWSIWTVGLGPIPARYVQTSNGVELALVHRVSLGGTVPPIDEREIVVSAESGEVIADRSIIRHVEAGGVMLGRLPEGDLPFSPSASFVDRPLSGLTVFSPTAGEALTDLDGEFTFDLPAGGSTFFTAALDGPLLTVLDQSGPSAFYLGVVSTVGPPAEVIFNAIPTEFSTAEVAGFSVVTRAHDWLVDLSPDYDPVLAPVTINVNYSGSCFAFYSPIFGSMNFSQASTSCVNTAYGSIIAHEYFHHLQNQLVAPSPAYAEAMADVFAAYLLDSPLIGEGFNGPGTYVRDLSELHQYPSPSPDPSEEGLPLAAAFWSLRALLTNSLGPVAGPRRTAEIWLASQLIGSGEIDSTVVDDLLLVDDDDADPANGTPNADEILAAFTLHGFDAPIFPIRELACQVEENQVEISWEPPAAGALDEIELRRNGVPIATVDGTSLGYLDEFPPSGSLLYTVTGTVGAGSSSPSLCLAEVAPYSDFVRGDVNRDGRIELADAIDFLSVLFFQEDDGYGCDDALDVDDNGSLQIPDVIILLDYLFLFGPDPVAPFPASGYDPTPDDLTCQ